MHIPLDWRRIVDFVVLAGTLYIVLGWASRARALRIVLAITALYAGVLVARQFDLLITAWLLEGAALISVALLVIVFQPEVRRALTRLDRRFMISRRGSAVTHDDTLSESAFQLAANGVGALFVVVVQEPVDELLQGGVVLGADISGFLIEAIFQKSSPLHDGAVVVEGGRITRAGAVLPLTQRQDVPPEYGTRHRAAMGLAERTDALCIVVSEERSDVTVMRGRNVIPMRTQPQLANVLENAVTHPKIAPLTRVKGWVFSRWRLKLAALGLSAVIWSVATFDTSSTVRVIDIPVEFQNLPPGLDIVSSSVPVLLVELRGRTWLMNSNQLSGLIARFNLAGFHEGARSIPVGPENLGVPPGVSVIRVSPGAVQVRLVRDKGTASH